MTISPISSAYTNNISFCGKKKSQQPEARKRPLSIQEARAKSRKMNIAMYSALALATSVLAGQQIYYNINKDEFDKNVIKNTIQVDLYNEFSDEEKEVMLKSAKDNNINIEPSDRYRDCVLVSDKANIDGKPITKEGKEEIIKKLNLRTNAAEDSIGGYWEREGKIKIPKYEIYLNNAELEQMYEDENIKAYSIKGYDDYAVVKAKKPEEITLEDIAEKYQVGLMEIQNLNPNPYNEDSEDYKPSYNYTFKELGNKVIVPKKSIENTADSKID